MADDGIDWEHAARAFTQITADMMHQEGTRLCGDAFYAEALKRLSDRLGEVWVTRKYMTRVLEMNRDQDRANGERAEAALKHWAADYQRRMRDTGRELGAWLRGPVQMAAAKGVLRKEGVALAASMLEGLAAGAPDVCGHLAEAITNERADVAETLLDAGMIAALAIALGKAGDFAAAETYVRDWAAAQQEVPS